MSVIVFTANPKALLAEIKAAIDNSGNEGGINTWEYDRDGDFTHTPEQWAKKAWLRPHVGSGILQFGLLGQIGVTMSKTIYGVYHGRFLEMLLSHFDDRFSNGSVTAQKDSMVDKFK